MEQQKNFLIPPHRKLSDEEVSSILEKYNLPSTLKLPKIKIKDPGLEGIEVEVGDVVAIERTSFAGTTTYYRMVIE